MRFASTLPLVALSFAALAAGAPQNLEHREVAGNDLWKRPNFKVIYRGSADEAKRSAEEVERSANAEKELWKRPNFKVIYRGSADEAKRSADAENDLSPSEVEESA